MKFFLPFLTLLFHLSNCLAQNSPAKTAEIEKSEEYKFIIKSAEKYFSAGDFHNALDWYEESLHKDSNNVSVLLNTAICHLDLYADLVSIYYLKKAHSILPNFSPDYHFWMASAYHLNLLFDSAARHYGEFLIENQAHPEKKPAIEKLISETAIGKKYVAEGHFYYCENLKASVNGDYSERNARWKNDKSILFFNSNRTDGKEKSEITEKGGAYEHIYYSEIKNGKPSYPKVLDAANLEKTNTELINLFDNDNKMLLCRTGKSKKIFVSDKDGNNWTVPQPFFNNESGFENFSEIIINSDGKKIIFSLKINIENENLDLFYAEKNKDGNWLKPQRFLNSINSHEDESFPFISKDGKTLFFSSKRNGTMGGYDIFKSILNEQSGTWSEPVHLGFPINSPADDIFSDFDEINNKYYLVSNRSGGKGEFDLFVAAPFKTVNVSGKVLVKGVKNQTDNYKIKFVAQPSGETKVLDSQHNSYHINLNSNANYKIIVSGAKGEILKEDVLNILPIKNDTANIIKDLLIEPTNNFVNALVLNFTDRYLIKIFYEPKKQFLISGHLIDKANNKRVNRAKVYLHNYQDNKIVAQTETDSAGDYKFILNPSRKEYYRIKIVADNYPVEWVNLIFLNGAPKKIAQEEINKNNFNSIHLATGLNKVNNIIGRVYFPSGNAEINNADQNFLSSLVDLLNKNPHLNILIKGYDDNTGEKMVNNRISHLRAENVEKYFIKKGISPDRLGDQGMGSSFFVAPNENEINGRDNNRRVEIEIVEK